MKAIAKNIEGIDITIPELEGNQHEILEKILLFKTSLKVLIDKKSIDLKKHEYDQKYSTMYNNNFCFEFTEGDIKRIQLLINELRDFISDSKNFDEDHKRRLLARLEKLQSEIHKRMSDVDRFWGLTGDAGVAMRKFGGDAKPIVDRIREISEIVWRVQSRAEQLPSDSPIPLIENLDE